MSHRRPAVVGGGGVFNILGVKMNTLEGKANPNLAKRFVIDPKKYSHHPSSPFKERTLYDFGYSLLVQEHGITCSEAGRAARLARTDQYEVLFRKGDKKDPLNWCVGDFQAHRTTTTGARRGLNALPINIIAKPTGQFRGGHEDHNKILRLFDITAEKWLEDRTTTNTTPGGHEGRNFIEGTRRRVESSAPERDPRARKACLEHHGFKCKGCGISMGEVYGEIAEGFIHVHHLKSFSNTEEPRATNPLEDLIPLCPNCHSVVHIPRDTPLTLDELRERMQIARRRE